MARKRDKLGRFVSTKRPVKRKPKPRKPKPRKPKPRKPKPRQPNPSPKARKKPGSPGEGQRGRKGPRGRKKPPRGYERLVDPEEMRGLIQFVINDAMRASAPYASAGTTAINANDSVDGEWRIFLTRGVSVDDAVLDCWNNMRPVKSTWVRAFLRYPPGTDGEAASASSDRRVSGALEIFTHFYRNTLNGSAIARIGLLIRDMAERLADKRRRKPYLVGMRIHWNSQNRKPTSFNPPRYERKARKRLLWESFSS